MSRVGSVVHIRYEPSEPVGQLADSWLWAYARGAGIVGGRYERRLACVL